MQFSYDAYANLIGQLKSRGYAITNYQQAGQATKVAILRHDADSDLIKALEFAKFEHSLGIASTYFILLTSRNYNVLARQSVEIIREIAALGHHIGLHFDERNYEVTTDSDFLSKVALELETLRTVTKLPIQSVSMHCPSPQTLSKNWNFMELGGVINSYSQLFFKEYKYVSDSRMHWREDVEAIAESGEFPRLHILTHPFWYGEQEQSMHDVVKAFCLRGINDRYECLSRNMRDLQEVLLPDEMCTI